MVTIILEVLMIHVSTLNRNKTTELNVCRQLRARRALSLFTDIPLTIRRALWRYGHSDSQRNIPEY